MYKKVILIIAALLCVIVLGIVGYISILLLGDYVIDDKKFVMNSATTLVDENGAEITKLYVENREIVPIKKIPKHVQEAFVAVEDRRFYDHHGIDVKSISRALYRDVLSGGKAEGGSTLTQQLAKNVFLTNDKTIMRKVKEVVIAINLEKRYTKKQILEMYLNQIYFGHGAYGIQAASKLYFNKDVSELTTEQGALLAALPKAPSQYSPILHPEKSLERRNVVFDLMGKTHDLTPEQVVRMQGKTLSLDVQQEAKKKDYLTYIDMVMEEARTKYHLSSEELLRGGYTITVPMNKDIQSAAYELFQDPAYFSGTDDGVQGAFVMMDEKTGGIRSVMGGRDYVQKGLNRVKIKRQPGSTIKPLAVYGPALQEKKYRPYSLLLDKYTSIKGYSPHNVDGQYDGKVSMYDAIRESKNIPAVWTLNKIGISNGKEYLNKLDMPIDDNGLSIALGGLTDGFTPLQMVAAYRTFAHDGERIEPHFIDEIKDRSGEVIAKPSLKETKVFSKQTAWNMTRMLEGVVRDGTASGGTFDGALAGKTGSTSYTNVKGATKDAWFVGYTPDLVGALWMGYDKTDQDHYLTKGSSYPTRLFKKILTDSKVDTATKFKKPKGVKDLAEPIRVKEIDDLSSEVTFSAFGLFTNELTWTPAEDKRVTYYIYEKKDGKKAKRIGEVTGKGRYEVKNVHVLNPPSYYVVPYNKQTKQKAKKSNVVQASI